MISIDKHSIAIQTLENAAQSVVQGSAIAGLTVMTNTAGQPLSVCTSNGCTGTAYRDTAGNVIITYQATTTATQLALDQTLVAGTPVSTLAGFADALAFAKTVTAAAALAGVKPAHIYVTGHSLGGSLSEYVASQTGLAGASFAGSGLGGVSEPKTASNFVSFVDRGDPFANIATDAGEASYVRAATPTMSHVGEVALLGGSADTAVLMKFISTATAAGISLTNNPLSTLNSNVPAYAAAWAEHALANYDTQIASTFGNETLAQIAKQEAPAHKITSFVSQTISKAHATAPADKTGVADRHVVSSAAGAVLGHMTNSTVHANPLTGVAPNLLAHAFA